MTLNAARVRDNFGDALSRVGYAKERLVIERRGKPVAALVPMEDLELLRNLEDRIDIEAAREALAEPGSIPWAEVKKQLRL